MSKLLSNYILFNSIQRNYLTINSFINIINNDFLKHITHLWFSQRNNFSINFINFTIKFFLENQFILNVILIELIRTEQPLAFLISCLWSSWFILTKVQNKCSDIWTWIIFVVFVISCEAVILVAEAIKHLVKYVKIVTYKHNF